jgi:aryl-phospho-beta-D-glucosidase BglC (GH1 family)
LLFSIHCYAITPVQAYGQLQVSGSSILSASGNPVQLRGMSLFWSMWMPQFYTAGVVNTLASDWKARIVRAAVGVHDDVASGSYLQDSTNNVNRVKTVVDAAIANGIYVIIDWHDHTALTASHKAKAIRFFSLMARTYGNQPNVIYEVFNEPLNVQWADIKTYATEVIDTIRRHDPDGLVVVGTPNWSQDVDLASYNKISGRGNVAYSLHFYAGSHGSVLQSKANTAIANGLPLFVTEWGTTNADGGTVDRTVYTAESDAWHLWMDARKISSCNWSIADKNESSAALLAGASGNGGWAVSQLTTSGNYVRNKLRAYDLAEPISSSSSSVASSSSVSNSAPTDISLSATTIAENAGANATVGNLSATDPDAGNTFAYTLVTGAGSTDNGSFNLSGNTLRATASLNVEVKSSYSIRIRVADQGALTYEKIFAISVLDVNEAPVFTSGSVVTVAENQSAVVTLASSDPDAGASKVFTITGGTDAGKFGLVSGSGVLFFLTNPNFEPPGDANGDNIYQVSVQVSDGSLTASQSLSVTVQNANETPTDISLSATTIAENAGANATVGNLSATDPDAGNTFAYTLVTGAGSTDNGSFNLSGNTLRATASLNVEVKSSYRIRIRVADQGALTYEKIFAISVLDVNEAPTSLSLSNQSLAESNAIAAWIGDLAAADPDASAVLTFQMPTGVLNNDSFKLQGSRLQANQVFDYAVKSVYSIRVVVSDQGGLSLSKDFSINILDVPSSSSSSMPVSSSSSIVVSSSSTRVSSSSSIVVSSSSTSVSSSSSIVVSSSSSQLASSSSWEGPVQVRIGSAGQNGPGLRAVGRQILFRSSQKGHATVEFLNPLGKRVKILRVDLQIGDNALPMPSEKGVFLVRVTVM